MASKIPENITFYGSREMVAYENEVTGEEYPIAISAWPKDTKAKISSSVTSWQKKINYGRQEDNTNNFIKSRNSIVKNEPFTNMIVPDFAKRDRGGKVFKAIIHDKFLVDLPIDTLNEVIAGGKIENGRITSPMIFAVANSAFRPILVGGRMHNDIQMEAMKPIKPKDLEVGKIYMDHSQYKYLVIDKEPGVYFQTRSTFDQKTRSHIHSCYFLHNTKATFGCMPLKNTKRFKLLEMLTWNKHKILSNNMYIEYSPTHLKMLCEDESLEEMFWGVKNFLESADLSKYTVEHSGSSFVYLAKLAKAFPQLELEKVNPQVSNVISWYEGLEIGKDYTHEIQF
jgi:hypothetical protein